MLSSQNLRGFDIGPVGYYQKQITSDWNGGGVSVFGGTTAQPPEVFGLGGSIGRRFKKVNVQFMVTQDIYTRIPPILRRLRPPHAKCPSPRRGRRDASTLKSDGVGR